jgi:hypothetical protein
VLSTNNTDEMSLSVNRGKQVVKPIAYCDSNVQMGGVILNDKILRYT